MTCSFFDYRRLHRGLANQGDERREVATLSIRRQGVRDDLANFLMRHDARILLEFCVFVHCACVPHRITR